jgi:hypothetical protein
MISHCQSASARVQGLRAARRIGLGYMVSAGTETISVLTCIAMAVKPLKSFLVGVTAIFAVSLASAQTPAPSQVHPYKPTYSERIEADNGAAYAVDLKTARWFGSLVQAGVYDPDRGVQIAGPMWFVCGGTARAGLTPGALAYVPPRSVGARLRAIACAEANRHPER